MTTTMMMPPVVSGPIRRPANADSTCHDEVCSTTSTGTGLISWLAVPAGPAGVAGAAFSISRPSRAIILLTRSNRPELTSMSLTARTLLSMLLW